MCLSIKLFVRAWGFYPWPGDHILKMITLPILQATVACRWLLSKRWSSSTTCHARSSACLRCSRCREFLSVTGISHSEDSLHIAFFLIFQLLHIVSLHRKMKQEALVAVSASGSNQRNLLTQCLVLSHRTEINWPLRLSDSLNIKHVGY